MIKIENFDIFGCESAVRGMRNPMNSWDKSDSFKVTCEEVVDGDDVVTVFENSGIGPKDLALMMSLVKAGSDHSKFMRMINVTLDITAPLYWWKEFDTYKIGTVRNSCSTMHKLPDKEFTLDDFSCEHLITDNMGRLGCSPMDILENTIEALNVNRDAFLKSKKMSSFEATRMYWWQMIQLLPSSYNQKATVQLNYEVLRNMYHSRKSHKLDEWREFCKWIEKLPYAKELICSE